MDHIQQGRSFRAGDYIMTKKTEQISNFCTIASSCTVKNRLESTSSYFRNLERQADLAYVIPYQQLHVVLQRKGE